MAFSSSGTQNSTPMELQDTMNHAALRYQSRQFVRPPARMVMLYTNT
jgi:hypothetical protein